MGLTSRKDCGLITMFTVISFTPCPVTFWEDIIRCWSLVLGTSILCLRTRAGMHVIQANLRGNKSRISHCHHHSSSSLGSRCVPWLGEGLSMLFLLYCIILNIMVVHATALVAVMCVISCNYTPYIFSCLKLVLCQTDIRTRMMDLVFST